VDQFNSSYWSGLDLNIFFNEIYIDDIVQIQYQITENVMPLMSWGDYTVRYMAHGFRIIQGSFGINFKNSAYMQSVLKFLASGNAPGTNSPETPSTLRAGIAVPQTLNGILGMVKGRNINGVDVDALSQVAAANQESFWGSAINTSAAPGFNSKSNFPMFYGGRNGFSIIIRFGETDYGKDERITYGKYGSASPPSEVGTILSLTGVHINGVGVAVDDSGRPIMEVYSFMAKDKISEAG
jgi:hypothetical protein